MAALPADSRPPSKSRPVKESSDLDDHKRSTKRSDDVSPKNQRPDGRPSKPGTLTTAFERPTGVKDVDRAPPRSSSEHAHLNRLAAKDDDSSGKGRHSPSIRPRNQHHTSSSAPRSSDATRSTSRSTKNGTDQQTHHHHHHQHHHSQSGKRDVEAGKTERRDDKERRESRKERNEVRPPSSASPHQHLRRSSGDTDRSRRMSRKDDRHITSHKQSPRKEESTSSSPRRSKAGGDRLTPTTSATAPGVDPHTDPVDSSSTSPTPPQTATAGISAVAKRENEKKDDEPSRITPSSSEPTSIVALTTSKSTEKPSTTPILPNIDSLPQSSARKSSSGRSKTTDDLPVSVRSVSLNDREPSARSPGAPRSGKNWTFAEREAWEKEKAEREKSTGSNSTNNSKTTVTVDGSLSPFPGVRLHVTDDRSSGRNSPHIDSDREGSGHVKKDGGSHTSKDEKNDAPPKKKEDKRMKGIKIDVHLLPIADVEKKLSTSCATGLTAKERADRLSKEGQNVNTLFPNRPRTDELRRDLDWHLVVSDMDYFFVLIEGKPTAVRRSGIVRGDVLFVLPGQEVPADMRIVAASDDLQIDPTNLTGVSKPVRRRPLDNVTDSALDTENVLWQRTWVVQGWAKGLVFHTGNACLTYRLLSGPESVNWLRITPVIKDAFMEYAKCSAFVKRADVLPELPLTTLLVTDIDVFKAGRPRLKAICIEETPLREWQPLVSVPADPFADNPALYFLFRAVALCNESQPAANPTAPLTKYALKDAECTFNGEVSGGAWLHTFADSVLLRDTSQPSVVLELRSQLPAVYITSSLSIHAGAPSQFLLFTRGSTSSILRRCSRVLIAGKVEDLTEKRREKWLRKAAKQDKLGREVIGYAQKEIVAEGVIWDDKTASLHAEAELTLLGFVAVEDELAVNLPAAIKQLASLNIKLLIASTRSSAHLRAWLEPLGLLPHLVDDPDLLKALTEEELKEVKFACGHLSAEARGDLLKRLRDAKHQITVCAHGLADDWTLRTGATVSLVSVSSASYTAKVVADVVITDGTFPSLVNCLQIARTKPISMSDIQLLEGIGVTELPSKEACILQ